MRQVIRRLMVGLTVLVAAVGVVQPVHAAAYAAGGAIGPSSIGQGTCSYMRTNLNGWLQTETAPPAIYARNYTYGGGNDRQLVRYRAFLVNAYTGATVRATGYSGLAWAWDNRPAPFSGMTVLTGDWRGNYYVDYRIEWLDSTGTRVLGWAAHRFVSYRYFNQRIGPYGPIGSCAKII